MPFATISKSYIRGTIKNELVLLNTIVFNSSGTFIKANYPGLRAIRVQVFGAGGGGGGGASTPVQPAGGGSGGYGEKYFLDGELPSSCAVVVGTGGAGGYNTGNGASGGYSEFINSSYRANGGGGGDGASVTNYKIWFGGYGGAPQSGHLFDYALTAEQTGFSLHMAQSNCTVNNSISGAYASPSFWLSMRNDVEYNPSGYRWIKDNNGAGSCTGVRTEGTPGQGGSSCGSQCTGGVTTYGTTGGPGAVVVEVYG